MIAIETNEMMGIEGGGLLGAVAVGVVLGTAAAYALFEDEIDETLSAGWETVKDGARKGLGLGVTYEGDANVDPTKLY